MPIDLKKITDDANARIVADVRAASTDRALKGAIDELGGRLDALDQLGFSDAERASLAGKSSTEVDAVIAARRGMRADSATDEPKLSSKSPRKPLPALGIEALLTDEERARPPHLRPLPGELHRRARARGAEMREHQRQTAGASLLEKAARSK